MYLEDEILEIKEDLKAIRELLLSSRSVNEKEMYTLDELPFSRVSAYTYEKEGRLKITRPNGKKGKTFVLKSDLEAFLKGQHGIEGEG